MSFISVFEVIGPCMIGPSSSHTAGAATIGLLARKMMPGNIVKVKFTLFGSFAKTYRGHGTDRALVGGILGFGTDDGRIRDSMDIAKEQGLDFSFDFNNEEEEVHPNTVDIEMEDDTGYGLTVRGESIGGGKARITRLNGVEVEFTGEYATIIIVHEDYPRILAYITNVLGQFEVNIASLRMFRQERGGKTYSIIEFDDRIEPEMLQILQINKHVYETILIQES